MGPPGRSVVIAGGGPAGSAAAILLARGGTRPLLIERSREAQDVVCGGFLGADAIALLARVGIDPAALGARPIGRVRLIAGKRVAEADLPFPAAGLSRRTLDAALISRAAEEGAAVERGVAIRTVDAVTRRIHLADESMIETGALFLATGKHELRGLARPVPAALDPALGLRVRLEPSPALAAALAHRIELHLFRDGYAGLLIQDDGAINLCLSVAQSRLKAADGQPARLIEALSNEAPLLAERFGAAASVGAWSSVARVPYGWRARHSDPGIFRLGDQSAVIASLAGDGIAIALASAASAAQFYLSGGPAAASAFQLAFADNARRPVRVASLLKKMGETPWLAGPLIGLLGHAPSLVRQAAALTRIEIE